MLEFIIYFIFIILAEAIGFWLGLRSQKKKAMKDIRGLISFKEKEKELKKEIQSGIIKAMTPEQFEVERRKKFEEENYG